MKEKPSFVYCKVPEDRSPFKSTSKIHKGMYFIMYSYEACVQFLKVIQSRIFTIIAIMFRLLMIYGQFDRSFCK